MKRFNYVKIGRVIKKHYPEIYDKILSATKEEIHDTTLIAGMYAHYLENYSIDNWSHKRLFIAAILQLYCPDSLHLGMIVKQGICTILADVMGFKERQSVSNLIPDIRSNMKTPPFRLKVEELCDDLKRYLIAL